MRTTIVESYRRTWRSRGRMIRRKRGRRRRSSSRDVKGGEKRRKGGEERGKDIAEKPFFAFPLPVS
jgi:hypothetical protein